MPECSIVLTTIYEPGLALKRLIAGAPRLNSSVIVVGDTKTPSSFCCPGADYYGVEEQKLSGFRLAGIAPLRHYSRKNLGYLYAMRDGAKVIIETDDDNIPMEDFWLPREFSVLARLSPDNGWVNAYKYFTDLHIWPRGLPLDQILVPTPSIDQSELRSVFSPILQGLADENPDVDAIFRLTQPLPFYFNKNAPLAVDLNAWCPFNSQNTTWAECAFPLLYLPSFCSFRMTDIWRSFVAQRIARENGWYLVFHNATVYQERNEHDLMRDFEEELPGYNSNREICDALNQIVLKGGQREIFGNMRKCYEVFIERKWVGEGEAALLEAWLEDVSALLL